MRKWYYCQYECRATSFLSRPSMAWNNCFRHVECKWDCQAALIFIKEGVPTTHPYAPVIDLIKRFINYPWLLTFHHSLREDNSRAEGESVAWRQNPTPLSTILITDSTGTTFLLSSEFNLYFFCGFCFFSFPYIKIYIHA